MPIKRILCCSDIHPGSISSMLPPNFVASTGQPVEQAYHQAYLWELWKDMILWATREKLDGIFINGDVVEGKQPKSRGSELCLPLVLDQEEAAEGILRPLIAKAKCKVYFIKGTFYHDDELGRSVDNVAKNLRATAYEGLGTGKYAKEVLDIDIGDVSVDVSHGISVSGGLYRAVALDREMLWATLAAKMDQTPNADVIIRAHAHYFVHIEHSTRHGVLLPAWQLQTSYMRKNSRYRMIPDIGAVILHIDTDAKKEKRDPCRVEKKVYPLPKPRRVHL